MKIPQRPGLPAFTLIELMAVITIIIILAGLVVGGMGFVNERQNKERARVQIALLSKALEDYRLDTGTYPPTADSTTGTGASATLFKVLYFDPKTANERIYLPELDPATSKQGWTSGTAAATTTIVDPWNNEYRYRSAKDSSGKANAATQNPDFDLWTAGKDGLSKPDTPDHKDNRDDIKNF